MLTKREKRTYITTARQLGYSSEIINKLYKAKTDIEATRIMRTARERS